MDRYRRCRSAAGGAGSLGPGTAVQCPRSAARSPVSRRDAFTTPQRSRRPATAVPGTARPPRRRPRSAAAAAAGDDAPARHVLDPLADLIPRLYRTYGYQFTSAYRQPAAHPAAMR